MSYADAVNEKTKDIKPVTREEMFLQKIADNMSGGSGTGGGGADLLNEHGFIKKEYLPQGYGYGTVDDYLLSLSGFTLDEDTGAYSQIMTGALPNYIVGSVCTVVYNSVEYSCVITDGEPIGVKGGILIGNVGAATGGEDTGEPFIIILAPIDDNNYVIQVMSFDGAEVNQIGITGKIFIPDTFDKSYSPFMPLVVTVIENINTGAVTSHITFDEIMSAYNSGRPVTAKSFGDEGEVYLYQLTEYEETRLCFSSVTLNSEGKNARFITFVKNGGISMEKTSI